MYSDYFKKDKYWKEHINKKIENNMWINNYKKYFNSKGKCLELGCGIGQYTKRLIEFGYDVLSTDISKIALNEVKKINKNVLLLDMNSKFPFNNNTFDLVFANLSIHYFNNDDTIKLCNEIYRVLNSGGMFIGSVNSIKGFDVIKDEAKTLERHFYYYNNKNIRLFSQDDLKKYLEKFKILELKEEETIRFNHKKNYIIFIAMKK